MRTPQPSRCSLQLSSIHPSTRPLPRRRQVGLTFSPWRRSVIPSKRHFQETTFAHASSGPAFTAKPHDLFRYTSGRWLVDEEIQQRQRYVEFDLNSLCRLAARQFGDSTTCVRVVKREGNFNKAFLLTMDDGSEVVAKLPCPNAGPPALTTASEVATLEFLRSRTSIRVPRVLEWSAAPSNPVGAEFIIMEKIRGVPLVEKWDAMSTLDRYKVIDQVVQLENELTGVVLPAYGGLHLRESIPATVRRYPLPAELDPERRFCIGPSCRRTWWHGASINGLKGELKDVGPWASLSEYAMSTVDRVSTHINSSSAEVQQQLSNCDESQSIRDYKSLLERLRMVLPTLSHHNRVMDVSSLVLWHTDLHLGNIFSCHSAPLFLQAQFPEFLAPPQDYTFGPEAPSLPGDFDSLGPEEQQEARHENEFASRSKYYEMSCLAHTTHVYEAMKLDRILWEPFVCAQLGFHGSLTHDRQKLEYEDTVYLWDLVKSQLQTDNSGWVPHDRWAMTDKRNRELYEMYIEAMSEELEPEAARRKWPFPPRQD
ncbi:phosphotransferase family protein [Aspergillus carlsbadensis]|nr:phosphotransferase family protein [Aspergillus carlsbadensis]